MFTRIKQKIKEIIINEIVDVTKANNLAIRYNDAFQEYRGACEGKDVYIVGCGPTESYFEPVGNEGIFIGVNRAYMDNRFSFDYLFAQDQMEEGMKDFLSYRKSECVKFVAIIPHEDTPFRVSDCSVEMKNSIRYALAGKRMGNIPLDISVEPVADLCGTVFSALQFAMFTNPEHIYLVGFDCSAGNSFKRDNSSYNYQLDGWYKIRDYIKSYKRQDLIISINPVGLKGCFNDVYTMEYISDNGLDTTNLNLYR